MAKTETPAEARTDGTDLLPLPPHPAGLSWPTQLWPVAEPDPEVDQDRLEHQVATIFDGRQAKRIGRSHALVVVHHGRVVAERYGPGVAASQRLISWSTAKSMLDAAIGILAGRGALDIDAPAAVPEWQHADDPRAAITLRQLLEFRSGLAWSEDYVDDAESDVIAMLFGEGQDDVAAYAAAKPLADPPGTRFCYSSGTSNIVSRIAGDVIAADAGVDPSDPSAAEAAVRTFLTTELFGPLGMASASPRFDRAGTWIASSYTYCTARDFARFAYLYLRDGVWDGRRLLPEGWVDRARRPTSVDADGDGHGAHFWLWDQNPWGAFNAAGYEGQYFVIVPALDLVVVRLGKTVADLRPALRREITALIAAFDT
jgi:CubicO group peptidase (beta-lactamase class C family)